MKWPKEFIRYIITGIATNATGLGIFYLLVEAAGLDPMVVISVSYIFAISLSFMLNKRWSFSHSGKFAAPAFRYLASYFVCYILNMLALGFFSGQKGFSPVFVQSVAVVVAALFLFLAQKFWVFRSEKLQLLP